MHTLTKFIRIKAFLLLVLTTGLVACSTQRADDPATPVESGTEARAETDAHPRPAKQSENESIEEVVVTGQHKAKVVQPLAQRMMHDTGHLAYFAPAAPAYQDYGRDQYQSFTDNRWFVTSEVPVSTFSSDVDTASYAMMRRSLEQGILPPTDSIRVEELVNYFDYSYPAPVGEHPIGIYQEMGPSPWSTNTRLLHVGINTTPPADMSDLPPANLVFLVDVSGSMQAHNKLHLLKRALKLLTRQLRAEDRIALVVYAGAAGTVLESTPGSERVKILQAIDKLQAGGSTNGAAGIHLAYQVAQQNFITGGINRVMLATDGDFNVGTSDTDALEKLVERKRISGVALTVLGFGTGNLNDHMMQKIAQIGDGNAAYIDTMHEARKVLVDELGATLNIAARDVKIQVEFNPAVVQGYRLIGYETRHLNREDFNNDKVDAGDVGEGHSVTALYEISLVGDAHPLIDPLRYASAFDDKGYAESQDGGDRQNRDEVAHVKVRYKSEQGSASKLLSQVVLVDNIRQVLEDTSERFRFSGAVAWFGQMLRGSNALQTDALRSDPGHNDDWNQLLVMTQAAKGTDEQGYRSELLKLIRTAHSLVPGAADSDGLATR